MFFIIVAIISALIFPYAMIKAITSEDERKFFIIVSCGSFGVIIGLFFVMLKFIIDNYLV